MDKPRRPLDKRRKGVGASEYFQGGIGVALGVALLLAVVWLAISLIRWMWEHTIF